MTDKLDEAIEAVSAINCPAEYDLSDYAINKIHVVLKAARAWNTLMKDWPHADQSGYAFSQKLTDAAQKAYREYQGDGE